MSWSEAMSTYATEFNHRDFTLHVRGDPPPGYPGEAAADFYSETASGSFPERKRAFLEDCLRRPAPQNFKAPWYELPRLAAGRPVYEGIFHAACDFIDARCDCADFILHSLLRVQYQFPNADLSPEIKSRIEASILGFKYWPDEPGFDSLCTWTENHQILYASAAVLAGQLYPQQVFTNSGRRGTELMEVHLPRVRRWLDLRFRTGFSEWLSNVYYDEDLAALISLLDFCADEDVRRRAATVANLVLLDTALHNYRGVFASTHGRSYDVHKMLPGHEATSDTTKLVFGKGCYARVDNMSAVAIALSPQFRLEPALAAITEDDSRPEVEIRQRMGIRISQAECWGLGFDDFEDGMVYLSLEAYLHPRTANLTFRMFDAFRWWENEYFAPFKQNRRLVNGLRRLRLMPVVARILEKDVCRNTREEVNLYTYRTPDYQLSSAVDYRNGYGGDQQAIWQATLAPGAVVFVTHPGKAAGHSPDYWTGEGTLPRVGQYKNVLVSIYRIDTRPGLNHTNRLLFTHAYRPLDRFDEVQQQNNWFFARNGDGYLALWARNGYCTSPPEPLEAIDRDELVSPDKENIWLCELGRSATHGSFTEFIRSIVAASLRCNGLDLDYQSPSLGRVQFGWEGVMRVDGQVIPLADFPRYDSLYVKAEFDPKTIQVQAGGQSLRLYRDGSGPAPAD